VGSVTDRPLTLLVVHAHPDDEAIGTGGILAKYSAEGVRTVLVTCTDGACGDGPGGVKPGEEGHDPAAVIAVREEELRKSCEVLGVSHLELLGYRDSGMEGWPQNDAPNSFWRTPVEDGAAKVAALIDRYQPQVIVTYDENGFYGHPDHIQAHRITMAAVEQTGSDAKVYWTTVPRSMFAEFRKLMIELGAPDWDEELPQEDGELTLGLPDEEISTWIDVSDFARQKYASLEAHASQGENIFFLQMGVDLFAQYMGGETFQRVRDTTGSAVPEDDLFADKR
jgi:LmbE family N-acetylglucosaminyl deacetylase